jgi:hypothetical protein
MMHEPADPHAGGTGGAASQPPQGAPDGGDDASTGSGDIEVPLGVPLGAEEYRRLKEQARRADRDDAGDVPEQPQEDDGRAQEDQS